MMSSSVFLFSEKMKNRFFQKRAGIRKAALNIPRFLMIAFLAFPFPGNALDSNTLPTGGEVTSGQGTISSSGNTMTVNQQSDRLVANWETFNIGQDASVTFTQPGAGSVALNRINDQNASEILGSLSANGQVFLLNPNGIIFGSSAQVNVGGLVASSLNITDENFMKGNYAFEGTGGSISNMGTIRTSNGGYVAFLSPQVRNEGTISAPGGSVVLAAGSKVNLEIEGSGLKDYSLNPDAEEENDKEDSPADAEDSDSPELSAPSSEEPDSLEKEETSEVVPPFMETPAVKEPEKVNVDFTGDQLVQLTVDQTTIETIAENKGLIRAEGGMVVMTAKAVDEITQSVVNNTGIIEAKGISEQGGKIVLDAMDGITTVSGTLDVSSDTGKGGSVIATGDYVLIEEGAHLNASGATGGGEVLVGGSWQGKEDSIHEATGTVVKQGAVLEANATDAGNGGTVVVWSDTGKSDSVTRAYGFFEAKGGINGGDGGRIETSGHWLDTAGARGSASASVGKAGEWLFDPYNVTISGVSDNGGFAAGVWTPTADNSTILNTTINGLLEGGTSVVVSTYNGGDGGQIGDITVDASITKAIGDTDVSLTLNAANSILVNQAISNTGGTGKLNLVLDADNDNTVGNGAGIVMLYADIATNGGNMSFGTGRTALIGGTSTLVGGDVFVAGAGARTISTAGGNVDVKGEMIVANTNGLTINSGNGNVYFYGLLNSGNQYTFVDKTGTAPLGSWGEARTEAKNGTDGGSAVNDSYLVNITSRLENSVAVASAGYKGAWIGAYRPNEATGAWVWADGPEANQQFFTQTTNGSGGVTTTGYYSNFGTDEPNGSMTVTPAERVGQFFGTEAQWNDLPASETYKATQVNQYSVLGFVSETNLANSPVTINAGTGTVTFDGAVGTSKALKSLSVTSATTAINGGAVTTDSAGGAGGQSYSGDITLDSSSTVLTMNNTTTDFTLAANKSITNQSGGDASLTIKTNAGIVMNSGSSIASPSGSLDTILWADSDVNGGHIFIYDGSSINTNGGNIVMAGGLDDGADGRTAGDGIPDGFATATATYSGVSIGRLGTNVPAGGTSIQSDGGDIFIKGKSTAGAGTGMGINFSYYGNLDAGNGDLMMIGESSSYAGIELSAWLDSVASGSYLDINANTVNIRGISSNTNYHGLASSQLSNRYTRITAGSGGMTLYGENTVNSNKGIEISMNATTTGSGDIRAETPGYFSFYNGANAHSFNAGTGDIAITANSFNIGSNNTLSGSGTLTIDPYTVNTTIGIGGGAGTLQLASSYFNTNFTDGFSGITIGNSTAGSITVGGATTLRDNTTLRNNSTLAINGALTANENLSSWGNGAITQTSSLVVTGLTSLTAGVANDITLNNASNNFGGAVSVVSGRNVSMIDSNAMTLGAVNSAGTVSIGTLAGDLTLAGNIVTTNNTDSAVVLNAGKNTSAGTSTGGNILVSGAPTITVGAGGRATLYSGSVSGSTGLTDLIGSGSGSFRYNSDEAASNYILGLGTGNYAVYREQPAVTVTAENDSKVSNGTAYSGGNGVSFTGLQNGDTEALFGGTLTYGGTSQGAVNAGSYSIVPSGYADQLGYSLVYENGTLTISSPATEPVNTPTAPSPDPESSSPSEPSVPEPPVYEPVQDSVSSGLTSTQTGVNGTQREENTGSDQSFTPGMGAGTGSASVDQINAMPLISEPLPSQGDMILSSSFQTTPVHFQQTGEEMILYTGPPEDGRSSLMSTVPLFVQEGKDSLVSQGMLEIKGGENFLSVMPVGSAVAEVPEIERAYSSDFQVFSLTLPDGTAMEIRTGATENGVLLISVEGETGGINLNQIVLTSLQTLKTELKMDLSRLKAVKVMKK